MLGDKDTVVIDVRNYYETCIGRIEPPKGGAEFLDPQMRNSREFPKWLNAPETKRSSRGRR
jgi:predicted sulfurtransferase